MICFEPLSDVSVVNVVLIYLDDFLMPSLVCFVLKAEKKIAQKDKAIAQKDKENAQKDQAFESEKVHEHDLGCGALFPQLNAFHCLILTHHLSE